MLPLILLLLVTFPLQAFKFELSVCAIFQDEAPYLREWIEYHRLLGVEHFFLYNNNSQDHYLEILKPYIKKKIVTLTNWPSPPTKDWTPYQKKAYNHCIAQVRNVSHWLAVIDIDEFIVPVKHSDLRLLLKNYENAGGLQIYWQMFGTSHVKEIPEGKTLIETLVKKAHKEYGPNYQVKTICRPLVVKEYAVHGAHYIAPWKAVYPKRGKSTPPIDIDIVRIHHYWTRDEKYFLEQKVPRRERYEGHPYSLEKIQQTFQALNKERDTTILRFVPELRKRLGF